MMRKEAGLSKGIKEVLGEHYGNFQQYLQENGMNVYGLKKHIRHNLEPEKTPLGYLTMVLENIGVEPVDELAGRLLLEICRD